MMIFAPADAHPYTPICNLSTAYKRCGTYTNLCSTIKSTYGTYCNLPTAVDPGSQLMLHHFYKFRTLNSLSSNIIYPFRPYTNSWAGIQPWKTYNALPADQYRTFLIRY